MPDTPNVVVVHTDDTGRYIGPYGHGVDTPNLQTMVEEGVLFRNAYCAGPTCSPSRGALLTGSSPHSNGLIGLAHRGFTIDDYDQHLAGYLSERGVETVLVGQQHEVDGEVVGSESPAEEVLGYDRVLETDESAVRDLPFDYDSPGIGNQTVLDLASANAAVDYLHERDDSDPFFLSVGLHNTHQPFPLDQGLVDPDYVTQPAPLPDVPEIREEFAGYQLFAEYVDECVGQVRDALAETGQLEDTVVLFTTDHGVPFPTMKCNLYDGGIGVSLIARFPEGFDDVGRGVAENSLVSQVDLFPTFCDLFDADVPPWVEGRSLLPLLRGETERVRDEVYGEVTYHAAYEPKRCVRTERYKYIRRFGDYEKRVGPNTDPTATKDFLVERGFFDETVPREELYDLHLDPNERENLVGDDSCRDVYEDLQERLTDWMERTDDPLLDGPVPKPDGATVDVQDGLHPDTAETETPDLR